MNLLWRILDYLRSDPPTLRVNNPIPGILRCTPEGFEEVDRDRLEDEVYDMLEAQAFRNGWVTFTTH